MPKKKLLKKGKKIGIIITLVVIITSAVILQDYISKHLSIPIYCILSIEIVRGEGSVSGANSGLYLLNSIITLQAHPSSGFLLQMWLVKNVNMGNESSLTFVLRTNTLVQVFFSDSSIPIIPIISTEPITIGFVGVKVTEHFTSLNNSVDIPQMNLFLYTGNHYYWVQTMLAYGNKLGLSANGLGESGYWLGCCIYDAGPNGTVNPFLWQETNGYFYDNIPKYSEVIFYTFIGTDMHLHTEFYVDNVLVANIDWSIQQSLMPISLASGTEFIQSGFGGVNGSSTYFGNEVIFTGYLTSQGYKVVPSLMDASGTMVIQTFVDGVYCTPELGYVYRSGVEEYWIPPPDDVTWYDDDSAEWVQSVSFHIIGNIVYFSSLPTLSSWCTGVALVTCK